MQSNNRMLKTWKYDWETLSYFLQYSAHCFEYPSPTPGIVVLFTNSQAIAGSGDRVPATAATPATARSSTSSVTKTFGRHRDTTLHAYRPWPSDGLCHKLFLIFWKCSWEYSPGIGTFVRIFSRNSPRIAMLVKIFSRNSNRLTFNISQSNMSINQFESRSSIW